MGEYHQLHNEVERIKGGNIGYLILLSGGQRWSQMAKGCILALEQGEQPGLKGRNSLRAGEGARSRFSAEWGLQFLLVS